MDIDRTKTKHYSPSNWVSTLRLVGGLALCLVDKLVQTTCALSIGSGYRARTSSHSNNALRLSLWLVCTSLLLGLSACQESKQEPLNKQANKPPQSTRPKQPIEYLAKSNVAPSGQAFSLDIQSEINSDKAASTQGQSNGYFSYEEATQIRIKGYHLPTPEEMNGILPIPHKQQHQSNANAYPKVYMGIPKDFNAVPPILIRDDEEILEVAGKQAVYSSLYGIVGAYTNRRVSYALRFWDEGERNYYSAFRYELRANKANTRLDEALSDYHLQIRVRYLGKDSPLRLTPHDMETICNEAWWAKDSAGDMIAVLPNVGFIFDPSSPADAPSPLGTIGRYWLRQSNKDDLQRYRYLELSNKSSSMDGHELFCRLPIRLCSDT